jgi:hypothetical protein
MKHFNFLLVFLFSFLFSYAQVGINTATPNNSAILDITSTNKGVLFPRVDIIGLKNAVEPVNSPEVGLMVWSTNPTNKGFYYWDGNTWLKFRNNAYAEIKLGSNPTLTLNNTIKSIPAPPANKKLTTNSSITSPNGNLSFSSELGGLFKVTYTVTYRIDSDEEVEFFIYDETKPEIVSGSETLAGAKHKEDYNTITISKILELTSDSIYTLRLGSKEAKITIYSKQTNILLEAL